MTKTSNASAPVIKSACEDTILLQQISEGDQDAFSTLYRKFQPRLVKFCSRILKNDVALAADITDEALIEVWKNAGTFSGRSKPSTWIHSIARFKLIGYLRKNKEVLLDDDLISLNLEDNSILPFDEIHDKEVSTQLLNSIGQLSKKHREIIELVYFKELSIKHIAKMLDISENTVKTRMFYARKHLKSLLEANNKL